MRTVLQTAREYFRRIRRDAVALYFAARDPRTPMPLRALAWMIAVLAISPIDLLPDLPILGEFSDLVVVSLGFVAVIRLLPHPVLESSRARAEERLAEPRTRMAEYGLAAVSALIAVAVVAWQLLR